MKYEFKIDSNSQEAKRLVEFLKTLTYVKEESKSTKKEEIYKSFDYKNSKIAVIGGGSWATAIIKMLLNNVDKNNKINWFLREKKSIDFIKKFKKNPRYLRSVKLDTDKIVFFENIEEIIKKSNILIFVIPSAFLKSSLEFLKINLKDKFIVSAIKGIIPEDNTIIAEFFQNEYKVPLSSIAVISGPCHAEEVALEKLSYLTIASKDLNKAQFISEKLSCRYIKSSISDDIFGTEYSSVLKNIFAIASGICKSLGYGDNFQAVLISNAIQEIENFANTVHPISRDIKNSAYLGDLLVTSYSQFSRNRTFGAMIGKGYSVKSAQLEMNMIAEGYYSLYCIHKINKKFNVEMPITESVYRIIYKKKDAAMEIKNLTEYLK